MGLHFTLSSAVSRNVMGPAEERENFFLYGLAFLE